MKSFFQIFTVLLLGSLILSSSNTLNDNDSRLNEGQAAPKFKAKDVHGNSLKLSKFFKEDKKVLLVFLRHAWCPVCNFRTHELIKHYDALKNKGYEVVVVYESKQKQLIDFVNDYELPYNVIADPEGKIYKSYKVERNLQKVIKDFETNPKVGELAKEGMSHYAKKKGKKHSDYKADDEQGSDLIPADFVLDTKGNIETVYYGKFLGDHLPIKDILNAESSPASAAPIEESTASEKTKSKSKSKKNKTTSNNIRF